MYTINNEGEEYSEMWLVLLAARAWMQIALRSAVIHKDGKIVRMLRY